MHVGFIGLGNMGSGMAANLLKSDDADFVLGSWWKLRHPARRVLVALFGHPTCTDECPLSGVKRT